MFPPIFAHLSASAVIAPVLGAGAACRVKPYGDAPADIARPYVTWQVIGGDPFNTLSDAPTGDRIACQFDAWGETDAQAREAFEPLRFELERIGNITGYNGTMRDTDTGLYRISFDWEQVLHRSWPPPTTPVVSD